MVDTKGEGLMFHVKYRAKLHFVAIAYAVLAKTKKSKNMLYFHFWPKDELYPFM